MGEEQESSLVRLAEQEGDLQDIHLNHVQILKTAHHGSRTVSYTHLDVYKRQGNGKPHTGKHEEHHQEGRCELV